MERVRCDWDTKHEQILKILQKHGCIGRRYSKLYASKNDVPSCSRRTTRHNVANTRNHDREYVAVFVYPSALIVTIFHLSSFVLIQDVAVNGTRKGYFPITTEYLIDDEMYFYFIVIHQNVSQWICASMFIATESLYIMWLQHAAGLFEIAR